MTSPPNVARSADPDWEKDSKMLMECGAVMQTYQCVPSRRSQGTNLVINGYCFKSNSKSVNQHYFRCCKGNCKSRLITDKDRKYIKYVEDKHNHEPEHDYVREQYYREYLACLVKLNPDLHLRSIYNHGLQHAQPGMKMAPYRRMQRFLKACVQRWKCVNGLGNTKVKSKEADSSNGIMADGQNFNGNESDASLSDDETNGANSDEDQIDEATLADDTEQKLKPKIHCDLCQKGVQILPDPPRYKIMNLMLTKPKRVQPVGDKDEEVFSNLIQRALQNVDGQSCSFPEIIDGIKGQSKVTDAVQIQGKD